MLGASFLPARFRTSETSSASLKPNWLNRQITPIFQSISRPACTHPIHTIVFVALLASTTYIGLLEGSLFDSKALGRDGSRPTDFNSLVEGGRRVRVGADTAWKWTIEDNGKQDSANQAAEHLALMTFVFPDSLSNSSPRTAPPVDAVPIPSNSSVQILPPTSNPLSPISQDTTLVFGIPFSEAPEFLVAVQEIPNPGAQREEESAGLDYEERKWVTKVGKSNGYGTDGSFRGWAANAWTEFLDLVKNAETLDIFIMVLGYLSMHLTFVSLFLSMRRLGSNFWLATTVLFSSLFAFLFGLTVTTKLGVPITMVLLSEGLPFLVVTIGFEKPIILTKAVLSVSLNSRRQGVQQSQAVSRDRRESSPTTIQDAVQTAVKEKGFEIVKDYCIEIAILVAGAASGVQGGLRQFCFLAAWILFFDCLLLFTFYTAILCIKLEINRIKRHVTLRKALEEDGVSRRVAENVASSNEWPRFEMNEGKGGAESEHAETAVFGKKVGDSSVPKFKVLMVSGFLIINVLNLCTIPFRTGNRNTTLSDVSALSNVLTPLPVDPFKVADNGLETLLASAKERQRSTVVTVLPPIKYELGYPSVRDADLEAAAASLSDVEYTDQFLDVVGGRVIEGVLKSLEDPVLSKWIIVALTMSLVLNGYLFNAARWSIKEPPVSEQSEHNRATQGQTATNLVTANGSAHANRRLDGGVPEPTPTKAAGVSETTVIRTPAAAEQMLRDKKAPQLNDNELIELSLRGKIPGYALEKTLEDQSMMSRLASLTRAVKIRRSVLSRTTTTSETASLLEESKLPYLNYNYENVHGACCENVIGYMPLPLGVAGPLVIDGRDYFLPMATTEGVLVASTSRGCKAINSGGGAVTVLTGDGMTRGPCVGFETLARAGAAKIWLDSDDGQREMKSAFNSESRFARLQSMKTALAGTYLYIRFKATTGDAMGMNMISKGVENALNVMMTKCGFDDMSIISVSGNFCTDKKPAAINWIDGRGKSVVAEAIIPGDVVRSVLKSDVNALVELNTSKNLIGSAMAGSIGGNNAHAANIVSAIFLATGQDPAQVVESANCITIMKNLNGNLQISVSMPCIEVGTIGGGTVLEPQMAMLDLLGVKGPHPTSPGANARQLARIIAAATLAGELSLCSALAAGHLVRAHMAHNRSAVPTRSSTPVSAALHAAPNRSQAAEGLSMTTGR